MFAKNDAVILLLRVGADPHISNICGQSAYQLATINPVSSIAQIMEMYE